MACSSTPRNHSQGELLTTLNQLVETGLLTCLLHFSLWVKGIMVSVVCQMLCQDLNTFRGFNISDPHHLAANILSQRTFKHLFFVLPQQYSICRNHGGTFKSPPFHTTSNNIPYPEGYLQLWASSIYSSCLCVTSGENPHGVITVYVAPGPVIPTR